MGHNSKAKKQLLAKAALARRMPTGREKVQKGPIFRSKSLELANKSLISGLVRRWRPIRLISGRLDDVAREWPISESPK